jgi:hypothetical protein
MTVQELIFRVGDAIVDPLILLLFSWALLMFFWGIFQFVYAVDDETARATGKRHLLWGIIGMVVIAAAKGILVILQGTLYSI